MFAFAFFTDQNGRAISFFLFCDNFVVRGVFLSTPPPIDHFRVLSIGLDEASSPSHVGPRLDIHYRAKLGLTSVTLYYPLSLLYAELGGRGGPNFLLPTPMMSRLSLLVGFAMLGCTISFNQWWGPESWTHGCFIIAGSQICRPSISLYFLESLRLLTVGSKGFYRANL